MCGQCVSLSQCSDRSAAEAGTGMCVCVRTTDAVFESDITFHHLDIRKTCPPPTLSVCTLHRHVRFHSIREELQRWCVSNENTTTDPEVLRVLQRELEVTVHLCKTVIK